MANPALHQVDLPHFVEKIGALRKWYRLLGMPATQTDSCGETVKEVVP